MTIEQQIVERLDRIDNALITLISWLAQSSTGALSPVDAMKLIKILREIKND